MGTTQSSAVSRGSSSTVSPSLALWAEDNDISPEAIAEAYGLGVKHNALLAAEPARPNEGLAGAEPGKYIGLDCEMVGVGPGGHDNALARISVVDFHGRQVYDSVVRPAERVTDWRTGITGLTPRTMRDARPFAQVQQEVARLLEDRIVVGHGLRHDLAVLMLSHPASRTRDTARFSGFKRYGHGPTPALRVLAREILGVEIQTGAHSSIEDARVAMLLFRKHKPGFDAEHANKYEKTAGNGATASAKGRNRTPGKQKKKKR